MKQYIDKSALVAEIEKRLKANGAFDEFGDEAWAEDKGMCEAYRSILSYLDTLEMKEVDLEKELYNWRHQHFHGKRDKKGLNGEYLTRVSQLEIAKHFFELGLKTQKGENYEIIYRFRTK